MPGIYAAGDVRADSIKRVASAAGERSVIVSYIHRYLADHRNEFSVGARSTLAALRNVDEALAGAKA